MENFAFGCQESKMDKKRIYHEELLTMADPEPTLKGGYSYLPEDIRHQHKVGICTGISLTQNAKKALGKDFSDDFQYACQKRYIDGNWNEGSAILSALKVGVKIGFLPSEEWKWTTEQDRLLPYPAYAAKLQAIPEEEMQRLIKLASDYKMTGYAQVQNDPTSIANAIKSSKAGVLCMYLVGEEWFKPSWNAKDINPLKPPKNYISGHAITMSSFDYTKGFDQVLANTWSSAWCKKGCADVNWTKYKPREVWIPYFGMTEVQIQELKKTLQSKLSLMQKVIDLMKKLKLLKK